MAFWHWLVHVTGSDYGLPYGHFSFYDFLSGSGSDLGELAIMGGLIGIYRKHMCEVRRCWRLGRHDTAAGHTVCRHHHPDGAPSHQDVIKAREAARSAVE